MSIYAYCLGDALAPSLLEGCAGVGGAAVRLLEAGDIAVVVSEFAGERVSVTSENVSAHNRVAGRVLAQTTPLPFRFGTLVSEPRLRQYVDENRAALQASLARVRGCVEMSVKIIRDVEALRREAEARGEEATQSSAASSRQASGGRERPGSGAAYLASLRREMAGGAALKEQAEEIAEWLAGALDDAVRDSRVRLSPADALAVRAAHLVERERLDDYRERVLRARAERARDLRFLTSGAWPPYSFSDALV